MDQPFWPPRRQGPLLRRHHVSILVLMDQPFWRAGDVTTTSADVSGLNPCSDGSAVLACGGERHGATAGHGVSILVLMDQPFWQPIQCSRLSQVGLRLNPCSDGSAVLARVDQHRQGEWTMESQSLF